MRHGNTKKQFLIWYVIYICLCYVYLVFVCRGQNSAKRAGIETRGRAWRIESVGWKLSFWGGGIYKDNETDERKNRKNIKLESWVKKIYPSFVYFLSSSYYLLYSFVCSAKANIKINKSKYAKQKLKMTLEYKKNDEKLFNASASGINPACKSRFERTLSCIFSSAVPIQYLLLPESNPKFFFFSYSLHFPRWFIMRRGYNINIFCCGYKK